MDNRHVNPKQFIVIPAGILHDKNISSNAKLLYGMILSLSRKNSHDDFGELGVCYSSNNYLAHNLDLSRETITKCIKQLEENGYIECNLNNFARNQTRRKLYPTTKGWDGKFLTSDAIYEILEANHEEIERRRMTEEAYLKNQANDIPF